MTALLTNCEPALRRAWHPVADAGALGAAPVRVRLLGDPWVLVRLGGELQAFPDRCPHRRVPLSAGRVVAEELECCYHGWRFAADGTCTHIPALGPAAPPAGMRVIPAFGVCERYGLVWLAPEEPLAPIPDLPECEDPAFRWTSLPVRRTRASAGIVVDNFFDVAHFSYLHRATFGISASVTLDEYEVTRDGWVARLVHAAWLREGEGGMRRIATYTMTAPFGMHLRLEYPRTGERQMVAFVATPETADTTAVRKLVALPNELGADALQAMVAFEVRVLEEDLAVLELIEDPGLPLDLRSELHTKADRAAVELRRMLSDMCSADSGDGTVRG